MLFLLVLGWCAVVYYRLESVTEGYAAALASCANGRHFVISNRLVFCTVTDVHVTKGKP